MRAILHLNHEDHSICALSRYIAMRWGIEDGQEFTPDTHQLVAHERYEQWTAESLLLAHTAFAAGDHLLALRCSWQAREYQARTSPNVTLSDAWLDLRTKLESIVVRCGDLT